MKKILLYILLTIISSSARSAGPLYFYPSDGAEGDATINTMIGNARLFGIFSGIEGDKEVAQYCADNFEKIFSENLQKVSSSNIQYVFSKTFQDLDDKIKQNEKFKYKGAFSIVVYRDNQKTYIAHLGLCKFLCAVGTNVESNKFSRKETLPLVTYPTAALGLHGCNEKPDVTQPIIITKNNNEIDLLILFSSFHVVVNYDDSLITELRDLINRSVNTGYGSDWALYFSSILVQNNPLNSTRVSIGKYALDNRRTNNNGCFTRFAISCNPLLGHNINPVHSENNNGALLFVPEEDSPPPTFRSFLSNLAPSAKQLFIALVTAIGASYALQYVYEWWYAPSKK